MDTLEKKIAQLPPEEKKKAEEFVDALLAELKKSAENKTENQKSGFGALKGMFVMTDDFDEPLEDFKDYM